jgi:RimJ/RimL family protein N-acetyltransferase
VIVRDDCAQLLGMWSLVAHNAVCWEIHTCLLPHAWGRSLRAALEMAEWIWRETPCRSLITHVPAYNRLALKFARQAGMTEYGVIPRSWLKDGILWDQIVLGLSKDN